VKHDTIRPAVDLPTDWFAHYHQPYPRKGCGIGDGIYDRAERCLGKSHYTYAENGLRRRACPRSRWLNTRAATPLCTARRGR
jgi:hypothetical protein